MEVVPKKDGKWHVGVDYIDLVATLGPSPTRSVSPNRNPGTLGLFLFIFRVIKFSFSKMS